MEKQETNMIEVFANQKFGEIRIIKISRQPYFVAGDIAKALGYAKPNNAVNQHCRHATLKRGIIDRSGRKQDMNVIPEGDVYRLIARSKLPTAENFECWVFDEVLPQVRKTGGYIETNREGEFIEKYFPSFAEETKIAMIQDLHKQNQTYKSKIKELAPQAQAYIDLMSAQGYLQFIDVAALVEIGRTKLFDFLRKHKVLTKQSNFNVPYGRFRENGMFKVITARSATGHISNITMVSPKGLNYIYKLIKKKDVLGELDAEPLLKTIEEKKDKGVA